MARFRYARMDERNLAQVVAKMLDEAGVPSIFCGEALLSTYGVPCGTWASTWVIADELIQKAYETLRDANFPVCPNGADCAQVRPSRQAPIPEYHFHVDLDYNPQCFTLDLHKKSALFWRLPDPTLEPPVPQDPHYMLVTDARLPDANRPGKGFGRWRENSYPIKILTGAAYAEAMFYLYCRDYDGLGYSFYWDTHMGYLTGYVEEDAGSDAFHISDVAQPARRYLELLHDRSKKNGEYFEYAKRVRARLIERNELPPPPGCGEPDWTQWRK